MSGFASVTGNYQFTSLSHEPEIDEVNFGTQSQNGLNPRNKNRAGSSITEWLISMKMYRPSRTVLETDLLLTSFYINEFYLNSGFAFKESLG